jgi:hypothetical protein
MQEHPIPQDITGYRFHIIGSMTLKQFGEVMLGVIVAFVIYKTNLIGIIKWPLVLISFGMGAAAAFLPIEERPLDHWLATFLSVLYKPTKFYWRREPHIPDPFKYEAPNQGKKEEPILDLTPAKRQRIKEYVGAIPQIQSPHDYTYEELTRMNSILDSFSSTQVSPSVTTTPQPMSEKPRIDVRVRKMRKPVHQSDDFLENVDNIVFAGDYIEEHLPKNTKTHKKTKKTILASDQVAHDVLVVEPQIIKTITQKESQEKINNNQHSINDLSEKTFIEPISTNVQANIAPQDASYNANLPFPTKPTEPNKLVGMVLSQNNELLTNTIVEIQTPQGSIARAVKTNALGQFFITTPLKKGDYNVVVEKPGYQFQPHHLEVNDTILQPMEIRSLN